MKNLLVHIIFFLSLTYVSISQIFSISEIHSEEFPIIKANFSILDESGDYYQDISATDFQILDYFKDVSPSIKVNCIEKKIEPAVSIVLILDMSQSMIIPTNNELRWDWVVEGAKSFINALNFVDSTKVAIIGFNDNVSLLCNFTNDKQKLIDAIENVSPNGGTLYNPPFLDKNIGAIELLKNRPRDMKRVAVFLTDGNPNANPNSNHIILQLQKSNIQVFSITLLVKMNDDLRQISEESGGKAYEIWDKYQLMSLYELIAFYVQTLQFCELSWEAPYGCSPESKERFSKITFLPSQQTRLAFYQAPERSVPYIEYSSNKVYFGNPPPLDTIIKTITITARYKSFAIDSFNVFPSNNFRILENGKYPFLLTQDSSLSIKVEFIQDSIRHFQDGKLIIYSKPCDSYLNLYAGNPTIKIINPNSGEIFSTCDSILIQWEGVNKSKAVSLFYSSDDGQNWNIIDSNLIDLSYVWTLPEDLSIGDSSSILIKAVASEEEKYLWTKQVSGSSDEYISSILLSRDYSNLYLGGNFQDTLYFDEYKLTSRGSQDVFLANMNTNGEINWSKSFGSPLYDSLSSIVSDDEGNIYITGYCYNNYDDNISVNNNLIDNKKYCFITKLNKSGATLKSTLFGATQNYQNYEAIGEDILFENQEIIVKGKYKGRIKINNILYMSDNKYQAYEATYLKNLELIGFKEIENDELVHKLTVSDNDDIHYTVENFSDSIIIDNREYVSNGFRDFVVYKDIKFSEIFDIIDSSITITQPYYFKVKDNINFGDIAIGSRIEKEINPVLINNSPFVLNIKRILIQNNDNNIFELDKNYKQILQPDDTLKLNIAFTANSIGTFASELSINFRCAKSTSIALIGSGKCETSAIDIIDFKNVEVNYERDSVIISAFHNLNNYPISINPVIKGNNSVDFKLSNIFNKTILPNDSLGVQIFFTPSLQDNRLAYIDWQVQTGCKNQFTVLKGKGLRAKLSVSSIDWGRRRELSNNDSLTYLINDNNFPIKLDTFYLEENGNFFIDETTKFPLSVPGYDSLAISIGFKPDDTLEYKNSLIVVVDSLERKLYVPLRGIGVLPVIKTEWLCGEEVQSNQQSISILKIKNLSGNSALKVYDCQLQDSSEFNWLNDNNKKDILIPEMDSAEIEVLFTPKDIGTIQSLIKVLSDAKPGNQDDIDTLIQNISCISKDITFDDYVNFNNNLLCGLDTLNLTIVNVAGSEPLIINNYRFDSNCADCDSSAFTVLLDSALTINPMDSATIKILFQPEEEKDYKSVVKFFNNQNYNISVDLNGNGKSVELHPEFENYYVPIGIDTSIIINANFPNISNGQIDELRLRIKYNNKNQRFNLNTIYSFLPNWTWNSYNYIGNDLLEIIGNGILPDGYKGKLIKLDYSTYLGDSLKSNLVFNLQNGGCVLGKPLNINIFYEGICANNLRLVKFSNDKFRIFEPQPNPANNELTLLFNLPFKVFGTIDLYNEIGNKILNIANNNFTAGRNKMKRTLNEIPSGIYSIVYNFEGHIVVRRLVIVK